MVGTPRVISVGGREFHNLVRLLKYKCLLELEIDLEWVS